MIEKLQQQSLYVRCRYFRFCICFSTFFFPQMWKICAEANAESESELRRVSFWHPSFQYVGHEDINFNPTLRLWISVLLWWSVSKQTTRSRAFPSLGCLWRNWRQKYTFLGGWGIVFSALWPSGFPLQLLLFKLSVYVKDWAAALQHWSPSGWIFLRFHSDFQTLHIGKKTKGAKESPICDFMSKHGFVRSQTSLPWVCFFLPDLTW